MYKLIDVRYVELKSDFYTGSALLLNLEVNLNKESKVTIQKLFYKTEAEQLKNFLKINKIDNFKKCCSEMKEQIDIEI